MNTTSGIPHIIQNYMEINVLQILDSLSWTFPPYITVINQPLLILLCGSHTGIPQGKPDRSLILLTDVVQKSMSTPFPS